MIMSDGTLSTINKIKKSARNPYKESKFLKDAQTIVGSIKETIERRNLVSPPVNHQD